MSALPSKLENIHFVCTNWISEYAFAACLALLLQNQGCPISKWSIPHVQVLLACMKSGAGAVLSDRDVCNVVNTSFRVVHQAGSKGELLQRTARHTMHELVRAIFSHLTSLSPTSPLVALPSSSSEMPPSNGAIFVSFPTCECLWEVKLVLSNMLIAFKCVESLSFPIFHTTLLKAAWLTEYQGIHMNQNLTWSKWVMLGKFQRHCSWHTSGHNWSFSKLRCSEENHRSQSSVVLNIP